VETCSSQKVVKLKNLGKVLLWNKVTRLRKNVFVTYSTGKRQQQFFNLKKEVMNWNDVMQLAKNNPAPPKRVDKTDEQWKGQLTPEQYHVTRPPWDRTSI
jgi:hypothetical protein